jgi:hypothetical protein
MTRRKMLRSLTSAALSLPFLGLARRSSATLTPPSTSTGPLAPVPGKFPQLGDPWPGPKISAVRPPIRGKFGKTFFVAGIGRKAHQFAEVFPRTKIYLNGVEHWRHCFEVDLVGGWVGVYAVDGSGRSRKLKRWLTGDLTLKYTPPKPKVKTEPVSGDPLSMRVVLDMTEARKDIARMRANL